MKKFFLMAAIALMTAVSAQAQKNVTMSVEDTQARSVDTYARAYVNPLTVELQVVGSRVQQPFHYTPSEILNMCPNGVLNLDNIRSRAIFDLTDAQKCDAIVAATFYIKGNTTDGFDVIVKGFPANFKNWKTAEPKDYQWIFSDRTRTTHDVQSVGGSAAIR